MNQFEFVLFGRARYASMPDEETTPPPATMVSVTKGTVKDTAGLQVGGKDS